MLDESIIKYRKPRATHSRISAAELFIQNIDRIIDTLQYGSEQDVTAILCEYSQSLKQIKVGREFLVDLIAWQKWKLNKANQ